MIFVSCFSWFTFLRRRSSGKGSPIGSYIGFYILELLENDFSICKNPDTQQLYGHQSLQKQLLQFITFTKPSKSRKGAKRKREAMTHPEEIRRKKFPIFGQGYDTFTNFLIKFQRLRSNSVGQDLNFADKSAIISFFSLFNRSFREQIPYIREIEKIHCKLIDQDFNDENGFHGPPGQGVAFVFHIAFNDGTKAAKHFCLGGQNCDYGCRLDDFKSI